jgi:phage portal protein BeeE
MPRRSTVHLISHVAQSLLIHGNAVVAKVRTGDPDLPPDWLWPFDWSHLNATASRAARSSGGRRRSSSRRSGSSRPTTRSTSRGRGPSGGEIGVSPLEKLGVTIRLEDAAQRDQTSMFRNGIRPSAAVSSRTRTRRRRSSTTLATGSVRRMHKGHGQVGLVVLHGREHEGQPLSLTPVEAALIEQRKLNREEVGMVYDLAGPLMNDLEHGTYSNVSELLRSLYRDVMPPWTELIVQTFQAQLIDPERRGSTARALRLQRQAEGRPARAGTGRQERRRDRHPHPRRGPRRPRAGRKGRPCR